MTDAGKRLLQAAHEALAIAKGEADPASYIVHHPPEQVDVRAIRKGLNMTQNTFGLRFGFGMARVRDWEQGRTKPAASDRVLLTTIAHEPDAVLRALQDAADACTVAAPTGATVGRLSLGRPLATALLVTAGQTEKRRAGRQAHDVEPGRVLTGEPLEGLSASANGAMKPLNTSGSPMTRWKKVAPARPPSAKSRSRLTTAR